MYVMEKAENTNNLEIKKEEIAADIKKALEKQEKSRQPKLAEQPEIQKKQEPPELLPKAVPPAKAEEQKTDDQPNQIVQPVQTQTEEPKPAEQTDQIEQPIQPQQKEKKSLPKLPKLPKVPTLKDLKGRMRRLSKRNGLLLVLIELILVLFLAVILTQHISLNSGDPTSDSGFVDEISCADGQLSVNTVSVSVPTEGGVSYSISYDWGKDDKDYPTVPKVAIASYHSDTGDLKYDISLYRDSFTPAKKVPAGKKPSNWFSDWKSVNDGNSKQEPKKSGDINGFLITTVGNEPEGAYETTEFYFAVRTKDGVSVYVAEGLLYDKEYEKEFNQVMEDVISSVRTKKQAA